MARNPAYQITFSHIDHSGEIGTHAINTGDLTAISPEPALVTSYLEALAAVTMGTLVKWNSVGTKKISTQAFAADGAREQKFMVTYKDNVNLAIYQMDVPCMDTDLGTKDNSDDFDLEAGPWPAYVTAFQALAKSPDGNAVTVLKITLVGRNV